MNDKNYYNYFEEVKTGADCINSLYAHTTDGKLLYVDYHNDENVADEREYYYDAFMRWDEDDRDDAVREFTVLCENLRRIAKADDFSSDAELNEVYNKYLAPIDAGDLDMDRISEIGENLFLDAENVSDEDHDYYAKWEVIFREEANARLGRNAFSAPLLERVRRYYRLIELGAPEIIKNLEEVKLAKDFVRFKFCRFECETYTHCEEQ